jgi:hypothetical protein
MDPVSSTEGLLLEVLPEDTDNTGDSGGLVEVALFC